MLNWIKTSNCRVAQVIRGAVEDYKRYLEEK